MLHLDTEQPRCGLAQQPSLGQHSTSQNQSVGEAPGGRGAGQVHWGGGGGESDLPFI